jgi:hypothetical protein
MLALFAGSGCGIVASAGPEPINIDGPDTELLEFLGGWAGEDDEWQEFFDSLPYINDESTLARDSAKDSTIKDEQENER